MRSGPVTWQRGNSMRGPDQLACIGADWDRAPDARAGPLAQGGRILQGDQDWNHGASY